MKLKQLFFSIKNLMRGVAAVDQWVWSWTVQHMSAVLPVSLDKTLNPHVVIVH